MEGVGEKYLLKILVLLIVFNYFKVESGHEKQQGIHYILLWTEKKREPFRFWARKQKSFIQMNCQYKNCFIVHDSDYFDDVTDYDAILFNPLGINEDYLPKVRSDNQIYVFVALEPAAYLPLQEMWNWFYNVTWTYKLSSDILYPYFIVRNKNGGEVVGPSENPRWITYMKPTEESVINMLENKTIAVAMYITNCGNHKRLGYAHKLHRILGDYNHQVDIYGGCGNKICPRDKPEECLELLEKHYYFYLAFENSYCEDYVSEKLMNALDHFTVPVVLGGANYSKFMPDGIYLNADILPEEELAVKIKDAIDNKEIYYDYFRWHRYYSYQFAAESDDTDPLCAFCAFLNDEKKRSQRRVYARFGKWWNEYKNNDTADIIVRYQDAPPHAKTYFTYRQWKDDQREVVTASVLQEVGELVGDVWNYYFEK